MTKNLSKFNILILTAVILCTTNCVWAGYDVIRAKTLDDEQTTPKKEIQQVNEIKEEDPDLPDYSEDATISGFFKNRKARKKAKKKNQEITQEDVNEVLSDAEKKVKEEIEVSENNKFQLNANKISYDDTDGNLYADGNVEIIAHAKNIVLKADNAVIDKPSQTIKLKGNVRIIKEGLEMAGQSLIVDLNEENIIMDNPVAEAYSFTIRAQESYLIANELQMLNGTITSNQKKDIVFMPKRFNRYLPVAPEELYNPELQKDLNVDAKPKAHRIDAKEIVITSYKDHDALVFKGTNVYYNKHKIFPKSDFEIISDKQRQVVETNMPEIGTLRTFGTYFGYGFVRKLPKGQTLKVMPAITYGEGNLGFGLIGRHRSKNSMLEAGYSSSTEKFVARGLYRFGNGFTFRYGRNAYLPEGFLGARRPGYAAQLGFEKAYDDSYNKVTFRHGTYAGIFSDYHKTGIKHYFATTRFRENLELHKYFIEHRNKEQDLIIRLGVGAHGSATVYGTGHTAGVIRVGPTLSAKVRRWESYISYMQGGIHGDSPFEFDKNMYGRSVVFINEKFNFNNVFALGFMGAISPGKDNYKRDLITETMIYALVGPKDLKLALSYDFYRSIGHLDFMFILGSDNTKIDFEKLTTQNMDSSKNKQDFYKKAKKVKVEDI